jgi:hypothetical protein
LSRSLRGRGERLARLSFLDDPAFVHENDPVGDVGGKAHLVRHHDHRHPFGRHLANGGKHLADKFGIERRSRLVEQHDARLDRERPGNRHALLLAAGQLPRILFGEGVEPDLVQGLNPAASAPARPIFFTTRSASVTLPSAVMCGHRLKCWNTMPTQDRTSSISRSLASRRFPAASR